MATEADPIIGNWYRDSETGDEFEVTALDEETAAVEVQYFDGSIEELELDAWYTLSLEPIEAPEDWTGPLDDVEQDDLGYSETDIGARRPQSLEEQRMTELGVHPPEEQIGDEGEEAEED